LQKANEARLDSRSVHGMLGATLRQMMDQPKGFRFTLGDVAIDAFI
jgi:hypothetical protein